MVVFRLLATLGMISGVGVGVAFAAEPPEIYNCKSPKSAFQAAVCSKPDIFNIISGMNKSLSLAPDVPDRTIARAALKDWLQTTAKNCVSESLPKTQKCLTKSLSGQKWQQIDDLVARMFSGGDDIEGADECDGCEDSPSVAGTTPPLPKAKVVSESYGDEDTSPGDLVRGSLEAERDEITAEIVGYYTRFWSDALSGMETRVKPESPSTESRDTAWLVEETVDPLTEEGLIIAKKEFEYKGATAVVTLTCDTRKKQLGFAVSDTMASVAALGIPDSAQHIADFNVLYVPSPAGFPEKRVFNSKPYLHGRTLDIVGFNRNDWGISLCQGGAASGLAWNSPFCHQLQTRLPAELQERARNAGVSVPNMKQRAIAAEHWSAFDEIRFSMRTVWGNPSAGATVPAQYFFSIQPLREPLKSLFASCERSENACLGLPTETAAKDCSRDLKARLSPHG